MKAKRECDADLAVKARGMEDYPSMLARKITVPISIFLSKNTNISPLSITYFSTFLMFVILGLFAASGFTKCPYTLRLIGACMVFFKYFLDQLDEKMARILHSPSLKGDWLSKVSIFFYLPFLFITLAIGLRITEPMLIIIAMLAAISAPMHYLIIYNYKFEIAPRMVAKGVEIIRKESKLKYVYGPVYLYILMVVFCAFNKPEYSFWFFAVAENLFWIGILALQYRALIKWEKRLES